MVPALPAVGKTTGVSGTDLLTAYVAGYETQYYLAVPILPAHYEVGWHVTSSFGMLGTATAVTNQLGLGVEETHHTLNIAASKASGPKQNFGSDTKPMHTGMAARAGVTTALLAAERFTADRDAIAADRGFLYL